MECPKCKATTEYNKKLPFCPSCKLYAIRSSQDLEMFERKIKGEHLFYLAHDINDLKIDIFLKPRHFEELCLQLKNRIKSVSLSLGKINDKICPALCQLLATSKKITRLVINGDNIGPNGWAALGDGLKKNKSVSELRIEAKNLPVMGGIEKMFVVLGECYFTSLKLEYQFNSLQLVTLFNSLKKKERIWFDLSIQNTGLERFIPNMEVDKAFGELGQTSAIYVMNLNNVSFQNWQLIQEPFSKSRIAHISWRNSQFSDSSAASLGEAIQNCQCKGLTFAQNEMSDNGYISFYGNLQKSTFLNWISIQNHINDRQLKAIADLIQNNQSMETCSIWHSWVRPRPPFKIRNFDPVAEALQTNKTLTTLVFNGIDGITIGSEFCQSFAVNSTMKRLEIDAMLSIYEYEVLVKSLKSNRTLKSINIRVDEQEKNIREKYDQSVVLTRQLIKENSTLRAITIQFSHSVNLYELTELCDALKFNQTITSIGIIDKNCWRQKQLNNAEYSIIKKLFEVNTAIRTCYFNRKQICEGEGQKNHTNQKIANSNTMILIKNIARDRSTRDRLPTEIWLLIFSHLTYPGLGNFESRLLTELRKDYSLKRSPQLKRTRHASFLKLIAVLVVVMAFVLYIRK